MPIPEGLLDFISCRLTSSTHPWPRVTARSGTVWSRDRRQLSLIADFLAPCTEKDAKTSSKLSRGQALWCHWSGKRCVLCICHLVLGSLSTQVLTLLDFRDLILSSTTSNILDLLDFFFYQKVLTNFQCGTPSFFTQPSFSLLHLTYLLLHPFKGL